MKIAVVIPYFQRQPGILRRALTSVLAQKLPQGMEVEVIIVDDGSPVPAQGETEGLSFLPPFSLNLAAQPNGGVAAARNAALDAVKEDVAYIAFLDSDDIWDEGHLAQAAAALEAGRDFYFCNNRRAGHHDSYFASCSRLIHPLIDAAKGREVVDVTREDLSRLILREFVAQLSTVAFRRASAPELRFDRSARNAGEDILFLMQLIARAERLCFSPRVMVECGEGINMYFSNLGWDTPGHLKTVLDSLKAHVNIQNTVALTKENAAWNAGFIATLRRKAAFLVLRHLAKHRRLPEELIPLMRQDKRFRFWFPYYAMQVVIGRALRLYRPA